MTDSGAARLTSTSRSDKDQAVVQVQHTEERCELIALARVSDMT
ncbi:hypothetical protein [Streptomyces noursei]